MSTLGVDRYFSQLENKSSNQGFLARVKNSFNINKKLYEENW